MQLDANRPQTARSRSTGFRVEPESNKIDLEILSAFLGEYPLTNRDASGCRFAKIE
jgi:hypothetical protein